MKSMEIHKQNRACVTMLVFCAVLDEQFNNINEPHGKVQKRESTDSTNSLKV